MAIQKGPTLVIVMLAVQPAAGRAKEAQTCRHLMLEEGATFGRTYPACSDGPPTEGAKFGQ